MISTSGTKLRFRLKTDGVTSTLIANSGDLTTDTWIHATVTYDGSQMKIYNNGVEVGSLAKTGTLSTDITVNANIGRNPNGYGTFDGALDDVRIYNRALTVEEIQTLLNP